MSRKTLGLLGLTVLAALAAYAPVLRAGFVNWDDGPVILQNPHIRSLGPGALLWMITGIHRDTYQPLSWLAFALVHAACGLEPWGYHAASVLLHAANAGLFLLVLLRLLGPEKDEARRGAAALFGALLFALHPLQAETVAVASSLGDLLASTFFLASVLAYLRAAASGRPRLRGLALSWALFAASGLSRWKGVGLPVVLLALDFYPARRLPTDPRAWAKDPGRGALLEKLPFFALSLAIAAVNAHAKSSADGYAPVFFPWAWAAGLVFYPMKWLLPCRLMPLYALTQPAETLGFSPLLAAALAALAGAWLLLNARKRPWALAAAAVYLAGIAPTLGLAAGGELFAHDRYAYLSLLGLPALAAAGLLRLPAARRPWTWAAAGLLTALLGAATFRQVRFWRDDAVLWNHVLAVEPAAAYARYRVGLSLLERGRELEAVAVFEEQRRKRPETGRKNLAFAWSQRGIKLCGQGRVAEALGPLTQALLLDPESPQNHANLGEALRRLGRDREAARHFEAALSLRPRDAGLLNILGVVLARSGRREDAAARFAEALEADPELSAARENLRSLAGGRSKAR